MGVKTLAGFASLFVLAACGGAGSGEPAPANLQGLWYQVDPMNHGGYLMPVVLAQSGRDIVVRNCNRTTSAQRLEGDVLLNPDGTRASWQPAGDNLLTGRFGASAGAEWRRFSTNPAFDSGRVSLQGASLAPLQANQDVCASRYGSVYKLENGAEIHASTVMITAPYLGSQVEINLGFESLRVGEFAAGDRNYFLQNIAGATHVQVRSPAYTATVGRDTLAITGGAVRVAVLANGAYTFAGTLKLDTGALLDFSAELTLERRP